MNQDIQYIQNNNNWLVNSNSQLQTNSLEYNTNLQTQINLQQQQQQQQINWQQQQQQQQQVLNSTQNCYNSYYSTSNNNNSFIRNQQHLNLNFTHNNNFILYDPNLTFQNSLPTMPNNNTTYYIDNNNNLQLHETMNNNIYTHNSYPSVMEAHNKMEKQILSHQQQQQQLQQQLQTNHPQPQQVQELYSNNKNYSNVDSKNKTTKDVTYTYEATGNGTSIYNNSVSNNIYNANQAMQMAQEIPTGQRQLQYQQQQLQQHQIQNKHQIQTTVAQQKKLQPSNNENDNNKEPQQHVKKSQQVVVQQNHHTSVTTSNSIQIIEKDLIDKTLEQQQIQLELKTTKEERDKIQLHIEQHKMNIENHERIYKKPYLITSKVNEPFPKILSLENWNFVGETTSRIYQTLNQRADFHKRSSSCRVLLVKKIFTWLVSHDKDYIKSHRTVDLVVAISDIINMIISLIELHRAPPNSILYLIIYSSDRFVERTGINHHQIFNLLLTSAIVNLKFWNECLYIQNKTIADIFSFSVKDLNTMERRFLYGLDYNLCVTEEELNLFVDKLEKITISQSNLVK
ncbi:hypothetical protein DICPUDRAFT_148594 [Dictyostelium purpureum]|uniref:Uncharacterized protein n=1 Tax=Dictyostelium purpureum TaxID=5786 RepID=F0ZBI7_DICPU|nr:uncharacterized protein DICPUDRAFT_148594 [Dictyostelium purpureum]EGC38672.1 hypothetical protein DICPUDRAFT_148594 [Dictyostelium purpureum]|eukprot:XP_003284768.1 hypothetical protein DICPUDRAFT_148594 [Dictyostelium purpureum]